MKLSDILDFIDDSDKFIITVEGHEVTFLDEYGLSCGDNAHFFVAGNEFGATTLIHSSHFENAWGAWIDSCPTIEESELPEAYGVPDSPEIKAWKESHPSPPPYSSDGWRPWCDAMRAEEKRIFKAWSDDMHAGLREYPELSEGYEYQSNASGTGIVNVGHYSWMREADLDEVKVTRKEKTSK